MVILVPPSLVMTEWSARSECRQYNFRFYDFFFPSFCYLFKPVRKTYLKAPKNKGWDHVFIVTHLTIKLYAYQYFVPNRTKSPSVTLYGHKNHSWIEKFIICCWFLWTAQGESNFTLLFFVVSHYYLLLRSKSHLKSPMKPLSRLIKVAKSRKQFSIPTHPHEINGKLKNQ